MEAPASDLVAYPRWRDGTQSTPITLRSFYYALTGMKLTAGVVYTATRLRKRTGSGTQFAAHALAKY